MTTNSARPDLLGLAVVQFDGEQEDGLYQGYGSATLADGQEYEGEFDSGHLHGIGTVCWPDNARYHGDFNDDTITGVGRYDWANGSWYTGDVDHGERHGTGHYQTARDVTNYQGTFSHGKRHGQGKLHYGRRREYVGEFEDNQRCGKGRMTYQSGNTYEGEWLNNVRHGKGHMVWQDRGEEYTGDWAEGLPHGHGEHVWKVKRMPGSQYCRHNRYVGEFTHGKRHGTGTFYYANAAEYKGEWKENKKHGHGRYVYPNGIVYDGQFDDDRMVDDVDPHARAMFDLDFEDICSQTEQQRQQLHNAILRCVSDMRRLYSFYAQLGVENEYNVSVMSRLQFHRLLKDTKVHQLEEKGLPHFDRLIACVGPWEAPYSINDTFFFRDVIRSLVRIAYDIHRDNFSESVCPLADCFDELVTSSVLPNACALDSTLFDDEQLLAAVLPQLPALERSYQSACTATKGMTARAFIRFSCKQGFVEPCHVSKILELICVNYPQARDGEDINMEIELGFLDVAEIIVTYSTQPTTAKSADARTEQPSSTGDAVEPTEQDSAEGAVDTESADGKESSSPDASQETAVDPTEEILEVPEPNDVAESLDDSLEDKEESLNEPEPQPYARVFESIALFCSESC